MSDRHYHGDTLYDRAIECFDDHGAASPSGPREALSGEAASPAAGLDPEAVRHYLWSERHESEHPGDGYYESCMECMRAADATIARLSRSGGEAPPDWAITDPAEREKAWRERTDR